MHKVNRSALVPYSAEQMFSLVDDIESYPEFLPWCSDARIDSRDGEIVVATLQLKKGGLRKRFSTQNTRDIPVAIDLKLLSGPFQALSGGWRFKALGEQGSKVSLELSFEFESQMLDLLLGSYFEDTCNKLIDAFTQRAAAVYGAS
ncbi:MAG: type II toxin-antitoxin system RatA family toxin [Woeseia sp.]|nr:type II toxin-antitoxin system RatA family toxin [Woeseia sp.]MBT8095401.1 type II toxin-antitoxin system RatA family toxin [Woeseia sp.]NNE61543.1 type II toxin-antitoxin system RatA family toxin [Woeseia sp.]NNL55172.1 type II toxin-antitoxin system RatA family toxin [Woeseia sp.]